MKLTLTGPLAGQTIVLNGRQFVEGRLEVTGDPQCCQLIANYYRTCYEVSVDGDRDVVIPSADEALILKAIAQVPMDQWVETDGVRHPKVADVALGTGKYDLTPARIIEVLTKWPQNS